MIGRVVCAMAILIVGLSPRGAICGDGVLEINQACAESTGCFPGDMAGFPVSITQPGSYRLTGNLSLGGADQTALLIETNHATLDLGGFQIRCTKFVPPSTVEFCGVAGGAGRGVDCDDSGTPGGRNAIELRNGTIVGMGSDGVRLCAQSHAHDLRVLDNGGAGIVTGPGSAIVSNTVRSNRGTAGIDVLSGTSLVSNNVVTDQAVVGILGGDGVLIEGNVVEAGDFALSLSNAGFRGNALSSPGETVGGGGGVNLGGNACNGLVCP